MQKLHQYHLFQIVVLLKQVINILFISQLVLTIVINKSHNDVFKKKYSHKEDV
jgi:hypothetical protein